MASLLRIAETNGAAAGDHEADAALIEQAKCDPAALGELYRLYQPRIAAYVCRRIGHIQEAEDVVSRVFLAMVRGLPRYRCTGAPFGAWLYRIATNEVNRCVRKGRLRGFFAPIVDAPDSRAELSDDAEAVREALLKIPLIFQSVLTLYYLEQLSVAEVARVLGIAEGTVKSRLARGRSLLKQAFAACTAK